MVSPYFLISMLGYCGVHLAFQKIPWAGLRELLILAANLVGIFLIYQVGFRILLLYVPLVALHYGLARRQHSRQLAWWASLSPILVLLASKSLSGDFFGYGDDPKKLTAYFIGISYLSFRLSYAAKEIRLGLVKSTTLIDYLNFAFFVPTLVIGPITRLSHFSRRETLPLNLAVYRIVLGLVKYLVLASLAQRLSYEGQNFGNDAVPLSNLVIAAFSYVIYLYGNFSGFCDLIIGFSGLIGISVEENFNFPLSARNLREFWNRWHITLSTYMRDMVFFPFIKLVTQRLKVKSVNASVPLATLMVFILIGFWHGFTLSYLFFGLLNSAGIIFIHFYTLYLRKQLTLDQHKAYHQNRFIQAAATACTFSFVAFTFMLFANDFRTLTNLLKHLILA